MTGHSFEEQYGASKRKVNQEPMTIKRDPTFFGFVLVPLRSRPPTHFYDSLFATWKEFHTPAPVYVLQYDLVNMLSP